MPRIARALWLSGWLVAAPASAVPVVWQLDFGSAGTGTFSYDPATIEVICPAFCDDPGDPPAEVATRLETFSAVIDGYAIGLDGILWWDDPPNHAPGHIASSRTGATAAPDWFLGDPFLGTPHQFLMSDFTEQTDGSWSGEWFLNAVTTSPPLLTGGTWRATVVPEPGTVVLLAIGLAALALRRHG
jgi:hypothetical protein